VHKEGEYRKNAAALLDLATRAADNDRKRRLLLMAEAWLALAEKVSRLAGRPQTTERMFREIFGEGRREAR
jgi:hypothetical protein